MVQPLDTVIVGGGIVGLATARQLLLDRPGSRVAVVEKEQRVGLHQTGHNSGVIHSGIYYAPGSLKAELCISGKRELEQYADERGIERIERGKLVLAVDADELGRLAELERRARSNGVAGLRVLGPEELREVEPNVRGIRALYSPRTGVIDYSRVAEAYASDIAQAGGELMLGARVLRLVSRGRLVEIETAAGGLEARRAIVCAGLQADRLAGHATDVRIVPFRGTYYTLSAEAESLVNGLVYPVPDPAFPFLGVHFTKRVDGSVLAGPNAVLALARERYRRAGFSIRDAASAAAFPGLWRFAARHLDAAAAEVWRDVSKRAFVRSMQRYLPALTERDVQLGPTGIRAQALTRNGTLADDFVLSREGNVIHVLNAPSPAATSSLAIARRLAQLADA